MWTEVVYDENEEKPTYHNNIIEVGRENQILNDYETINLCDQKKLYPGIRKEIQLLNVNNSAKISEIVPALPPKVKKNNLNVPLQNYYDNANLIFPRNRKHDRWSLRKTNEKLHIPDNRFSS